MQVGYRQWMQKRMPNRGYRRRVQKGAGPVYVHVSRAWLHATGRAAARRSEDRTTTAAATIAAIVAFAAQFSVELMKPTHCAGLILEWLADSAKLTAISFGDFR